MENPFRDEVKSWERESFAKALTCLVASWIKWLTERQRRNNKHSGFRLWWKHTIETAILLQLDMKHDLLNKWNEREERKTPTYNVKRSWKWLRNFYRVNKVFGEFHQRLIRFPNFQNLLTDIADFFRSPSSVKNRLMKFNSKSKSTMIFFEPRRFVSCCRSFKEEKTQKKNEIKHCAVGYFALTQLLIYADKIYCLRDLGWKL